MCSSRKGRPKVLHVIIQPRNDFYLRRRLVSGEGIVSLDVRLSRCVCVHHISLSGEGNALYPVVSSCCFQSVIHIALAQLYELERFLT